MNVIFNCTTNIVGGGLKNSAFFIKKAMTDPTFNWHFAVSRPVYDLLKEWGLDITQSHISIFEISPSKNLSSRKELKELALNLKADLVYTMAGPAYVKFQCLHLQGISNGYITHADWKSFRLRGNIFNTFRYCAHVGFQFLYSLKATHFVFQTKNAKYSFQKRSRINNERLFVIPNAFDVSLREYFNQENTLKKENSEINILCPGAGHLHKGFQFIPVIAQELSALKGLKFKFTLTLSFESELWKQIETESNKLRVSEYIHNFGPYSYSNLKKILGTCDIVFVPSLLETFSASYLEAMCARKKLVVADKLFSREVCGNYATYVDPQNAKSTAHAFEKLFSNYIPTKEEIELADTILNKYGDQERRYAQIIELIKKLILK